MSEPHCPNGCSGCDATIRAERLRADAMAYEAMKMHTRWGDAITRANSLEASLLALVSEVNK